MFNQNAVAIILSKPSRVACEGSLFGERVKKIVRRGKRKGASL